MPTDVVCLAHPPDVRTTGGFLAQRFEANRMARLNDVMLSEQFIRLHEHKSDSGWFWMGEQLGKWLDAAAYSGLITGDKDLLCRWSTRPPCRVTMRSSWGTQGTDG